MNKWQALQKLKGEMIEFEQAVDPAYYMGHESFMRIGTLQKVTDAYLEYTPYPDGNPHVISLDNVLRFRELKAGPWQMENKGSDVL